ncbi:DUF6566 family protein [Burkholderia multivorans]|uniref:DUF6566 family protein n=1 Tax=Burkholderia multivorans TaxID=87883 RepID=UPI001C24AE95|nr:DUF6566 family protein [Burkholderia multivorans]MBU9254322.1 hypothetical protein [Burkholderia multivorans]
MRRTIEQFVDDFGGYDIFVDCEQHELNGEWTMSFQIYKDGVSVIPRRRDSDHAYPTAKEAQSAGVDQARNIIRKLVQ